MLKYFCFLTKKRVLSAQAVPVQVVPRLLGGTVHLQLGGWEGLGLSEDVVCLQLGEPGELRLSVSVVRLWLRGLILAGLLKFEKN